MRCSPPAAAILAVVLLAVPASAQTARATGTVRDTSGRAIKGATITATNPDAHPPEFTAVSDNNGRWAMIGLRSGTWSFHIQADGFNPVEASAQMRVAGSPPMAVTLEKALAPLPDALASNIQQQLAAANALRDQGRLDQALTAYQEIRSKNRKLTSVNLIVADLYRRKAAQEKDPAARRAWLERAIASYNELLAGDSGHERARRELEITTSEAAALR
jgi:hypothetical protein